MMIRSALQLKALPEMRDDNDLCTWIPVDTASYSRFVWGFGPEDSDPAKGGGCGNGV